MLDNRVNFLLEMKVNLVIVSESQKVLQLSNLYFYRYGASKIYKAFCIHLRQSKGERGATCIAFP